MRNEILDYFRKANGEFVSGQQISKDLHVSRTAIWKHIKVLKERGYIFESSTRKGYRLIYAPNLLTPLEIDSALHTETFGRRVVYMSSTRSTNEEAKKIAREGAEEGTIVVAEEQTSGHGRLTRGFYSPFAKGIWFSLILRPKFFPMEASKCTLLAAIGVCRGIRRLGLKDAGIKWPNDILYHGKKMVGILTEMSASMEKIDYIIMGIGINTGMKKSEFPEAFRETSTSFLNEGIDVSRKDLLAAVLAELEKEYHIAQTQGCQFHDPEGCDGLDSVRHNLRALRNANLPDTRLIICSMEGDWNYPDIDRLLASDEFSDMADRVVVTAEPSYLARFSSTNQVVTYQRRFMKAAQGQS